MTRRFKVVSTHCPAAHGLGHHYVNGCCTGCGIEQCEEMTSYGVRCRFPKYACRYHPIERRVIERRV